MKPGAYPWRNHRTRGDPAHIHFSVFGRAFTQRLVTQMYFPGDPLFAYDPIFNSVRDSAARELLVARFDLETTEPEWALAYHWDVVLRKTPFESMRTPSQTVGPFFSLSGSRVGRSTSCREARSVSPDRCSTATACRSTTRCSSSGTRRMGSAAARPTREGRFAFLVPEGGRRFELLVFARGLLKPVLTRVHLDGDGADDPTQVAERDGDGFRFDVRLQGEGATAFYEL